MILDVIDCIMRNYDMSIILICPQPGLPSSRT